MFRGQQFEGEWWQPENPAVVFQGTLSLDEKCHGTLRLKGTEEEIKSLPIYAIQQTLFFGRSIRRYETKLRPGTKLTLFNCGPIHGYIASPDDPVWESEFYTNSIIFGAHVESDDYPFVNLVKLNITGLEEWCDLTGIGNRFEGFPCREVSASFVAGATDSYDLGDGRSIKFLSEYRGPIYASAQKRLSIQESNFIELSFNEAISLNQLKYEIYAWETFIAFALRRPSYFDRLELLQKTDQGSQSIGMLVSPGHPPDNRHYSVRLGEILFCQSTIETKIGDIVKAWRENIEKIDYAILLLNDAICAEHGYHRSVLLLYLQALETLHRGLYDFDKLSNKIDWKTLRDAAEKSIPEDIEPELRKEIKQALGLLGKATLFERLEDLFSKYPKSLKPLFPGHLEELKLLKDVRNFLTHYGDNKKFEKGFLWSPDIMRLQDKTRLFLETCLLGVVGLDDDEIWGLMRQSDIYQDACHGSARENQ